MQLEEQPLCPTVVVGEAGGDFAIPVKLDTPGAELLLRLLDVRLRVRPRMGAVLDGGVLGRKTECVPPHRVEDLKAAHDLHPCDQIPDDVVAPVSDM